MKHLDELPLPARDLVDMHAYRRAWLAEHGRFSVNLATTRGCPYHCNWCAKPIWGQRYNGRSPENVVAEIAALRASFGPDHLTFADDIFGLKRGWIEEFADLVVERDLVLPFKCLSRPDLLARPGTVDALVRAGCETVWIGAESGSQRILDAMEKGTQVEQIRAAAELVHAAGFKIGFFIQFGYPGEQFADIEATFELISEAQPDDIGVSVSYPLPGTPFHDRVLATLGEKNHWSDSSDLAMLYEGPYSTEFYRQLHTVLHLEFRSAQTIRAARTSKRPPHPLPLARVARDRARLPWERRRLKRLARSRRPAVQGLPVALSPEAAAVPSSQPVSLAIRSGP